MQNWLKTVIHVHTDYSIDSNTSPEALADLVRQCGVHCLAVTDHDCIAGAQAVREASRGDFQVIIGEEITTSQGHLLGLFLEEPIAPGLPARHTAELIRRQGGVVIAPHPFNSLFGCGLRQHVYELIDVLDAVEVCNAQNLLPFPNRKAARFACDTGVPALAGTDMHHGRRLDACFQWMPPFDDAESFRAALPQAQLVTGRHSLTYFARSARFEFWKQSGLRLPAGYGRNLAQIRPTALMPGRVGA